MFYKNIKNNLIMKNYSKIKKQVTVLFIAAEEKKENPTNDVEAINCKEQNEVDEFTEIWELVKS